LIVVPHSDREFEKVFDQDRMTELGFVLTRDLDEIISLAPRCLLKYGNDGILDQHVWVVNVDEDLLDGVGIEAR